VAGYWYLHCTHRDYQPYWGRKIQTAIDLINENSNLVKIRSPHLLPIFSIGCFFCRRYQIVKTPDIGESIRARTFDISGVKACGQKSTTSACPFNQDLIKFNNQQVAI
jgi:hypothetical protein